VCIYIFIDIHIHIDMNLKISTLKIFFPHSVWDRQKRGFRIPGFGFCFLLF